MRTDGRDYRLDVMVQPSGGDSTRVVFRGEFCHVYDGALTCYPQTPNSPGWFVVANAGGALLQRVSANMAR